MSSATMRHRLRALALCAAGLWAVAGHAALFEDDEARKAILDLRQRVEANRLASESAQARLIERLTDENAVLKRSLLDLAGQIETLRADLARLRGQDEQLQRDVAGAPAPAKDITQGVDDRLRRFEPVKVTVDGREFMADPAEKRDFDAALAVFRKGEFAAAQTAWVDFVRRYPQSGYGPSALFWLGNAQYAHARLQGGHRQLPFAHCAVAGSPARARGRAVHRQLPDRTQGHTGRAQTLDDLVKAYPQSEAAAAGKERLARLK